MSDSNVFDIKKSVEVSNDEHGDSIITSLLKGGIILNPANQKYAGGGVYSDHPHNAMEENLCRQSDLITSILKFIDIKFPNGYDQRKTLMFLGQSGKNTYGNVQKCLVSENTFRYIKDGNKFKELEHPRKRIVLSIASPNMKKFKQIDLSDSDVLNKYRTDMESYWRLAIAATIDTYKKLKLDNPRLIAVMPGDFIKIEGVENDELAKIAAVALKTILTIIKNPNLKVIFARKTKITDICNKVFQNN